MYRRIVVKIGTGVLLNNEGAVDTEALQRIVEEISLLKKQGVEIVLVTSGAVGFGRERMSAVHFSRESAHTKVLAAVGQVRLIHAYDHFFDTEGIVCAQILVTKEDFRDRDHYHNMRETFLELLQDNIIPIVNENDVIAHKHVSFTDNDELAGLIAAQLEVDAAVILSSVDGVLSIGSDDASAHTIPSIDLAQIDSFQKLIFKKKTAAGRGGMQTKFMVAKRLMVCGIAVHIAHGKRTGVLQAIMQQEAVGTHFIPAHKISGVKRRLAYADGFAMGTIVVNKRAGELLSEMSKAMSILPVGIVRTEKDFKKGDIIEILDENSKKIGFGIAASDARDIQVSIGMRGSRIAVHYDYLTIIT